MGLFAPSMKLSLDHEPFSLENQLLTVSFKKARAKIKAKYGL
jgi:hypothetical protein